MSIYLLPIDDFDSLWDHDATIIFIQLFCKNLAFEGALLDRVLNKKHDEWLNISLQMKMDRGEVEWKMLCLIKQYQRALKKKIGSVAADVLI